MYHRKNSLSTPDTFNFPYQPYDIQHGFMQALYSVIEHSKIGIFESPTGELQCNCNAHQTQPTNTRYSAGTGKTLSLLCGTLQWLCDHEASVRHDLQHEIGAVEAEIRKEDEENTRSLNWLDGQFDVIQKKEKLAELKQRLKELDAIDAHVDKLRLKVKSDKKRSTNRKNFVDSIGAVADNDRKNTENHTDEDADLVIEDKDSDNDDSDDEPTKTVDETQMQQSTQVREYSPASSFDPSTFYSSILRNLQIFFCSRTHSQLSQVVNEIKNTIYARDIRVVSLASRQQYCINADVRRLKSNALINERCLELKKAKPGRKCCGQVTHSDADGRTAKKSRVTKAVTASKCPYNTADGIETLGAMAVGSEAVVDIEELIRKGREEEACPYYAARHASTNAQIIMLPYQMLLHKKTRQQMNLNLGHSIVIIDEAHNLLDTISTIHSAEIRYDQMQLCQRQLTAYKNKYINRFGVRNLLRLNQLISIAQRLLKVFSTTNTEASAATSSSSRMIHVHELMDDTNITHSNLAEIVQFCDDTRLAQKVHGYALRYGVEEVKIERDKPRATAASYLQRLADQKMNKTKSTAMVGVGPKADEQPAKVTSELVESAQVLRMLLTFLECLLEESADGRVLIAHDVALKSKSFIKYLLLNPSGRFGDILRQCRAVIVAGGTMQPTTEFTQQLFAAEPNRIEQHFFGHVVAADAVLPLVVSRGPKNTNFLFNYTTRGNKDMVSEDFRISLYFNFFFQSLIAKSISFYSWLFIEWPVHRDCAHAHGSIVFANWTIYSSALSRPSSRYFPASTSHSPRR